MSTRRWVAVGAALAVAAVLAALGWWATSGGGGAAVAASDPEPTRSLEDRRRTRANRPRAATRRARVSAVDPADAPVADLDTGGEDVPVGPVEIGGVVVDTRGEIVPFARVVVSCDGDRTWAQARHEGEFSALLRGDPGSCEIVALRMDGLLPSRSDPVEVDTAPGDVIDVELVVPAERTGGIGVYIAEHDEGILVAGVLPGTPAWEAGLRDGDVIVEVDGLATAALELEEFQQVMTGPEETEVEFVVSLPGDTGDSLMTVTATRRYLDRSLLGG